MEGNFFSIIKPNIRWDIQQFHFVKSMRLMGEGGRHSRHVPPPPSYFFLEKNCPQAKKYNINKICQIKPRFKKMTCLMTIAETKKTSSAFRFFHKNYWNNVWGKLIAAIRAKLVTWKGWNYGNPLHRYVVSKK